MPETQPGTVDAAYSETKRIVMILYLTCVLLPFQPNTGARRWQLVFREENFLSMICD
jgi:hypothetical protein